MRRSRRSINPQPGKPAHALEGLLVPSKNPKARIKMDWRKTTRVTASGKTQTGRYQNNQLGATVQAGHPDAYASGAPQEFMLEDADLNQVSGQTIESKGAYSFKDKVLVTRPDGSDGVLVDRESLEHWERLGVVPAGTSAKAIKVP
jgi:hypothetical protein